MLPFCCVLLAYQLARSVAGQRRFAELHHADALVQGDSTVHLGNKVPHGLLVLLFTVYHNTYLFAQFFYDTFLYDGTFF